MGADQPAFGGARVDDGAAADIFKTAVHRPQKTFGGIRVDGSAAAEVVFQQNAGIADVAGVGKNACLQGGGVAEADQRFGILSDKVIIEQRQQILCAETAGSGKNRPDFRIGKKTHQVFRLLFGRAGHVVEPVVDVRAENNPVPAAFQPAQSVADVFRRIERRRRGNNADF